MTAREYALLLSCACDAVNGPELVESVIYDSARAASADAPSRPHTGLEHAVMVRSAPGDPWREMGTGRSAVETIRARWAS